MRLLPALLSIVALVNGAGPAVAGALSVMPIRVEVKQGQRFCALTVGNDSDQPVTVQVRGFGWSRDEQGQDLLDPATGPVVNPAILTIPGKENRLVRCGLPATGPSAVEEQWRLLVDQLPAPASEVPAGTVQTLLRLSIPVFRVPEGARPELTWAPLVLPDGGNALRLTNSGSRRVQIARLDLGLEKGAAIPLERGFYLLAGTTAVVRLPAAASDRTVSVAAVTDLGPINIARKSGLALELSAEHRPLQARATGR